MTTDFDGTPVQYFTYVNGTEYGPYTLEQVQQFIGTGNIVANSYLRTEGTEWVEAHTVPELNALFASAQPAGGAYPVAPGGAYAYAEPGALVLPQGVELASRGRRVGAYFLAIPLMIVTLFIGYIIWGAIVWSKGTSPALQVLGMRAWKPNEARPASWGDMAMRNIIGGFLQGILSVITLLVSFVMFLTDDRNRTIPDRIGGTIIVSDPNKILG